MDVTNTNTESNLLDTKLAASWMLYALLIGLGLFFFVLSMCYLYTFFEGDLQIYKLPPHFYINTFILLFSSFCIHNANEKFKINQLNDTVKYLKYTLCLSIVFLIVQVLGWVYLSTHSLPLINSNASVAYLYLLSSLHFLHIVAGVVALAIAWHRYRKQLKNEVYFLIDNNNPNKKERFNLLVIYWHFVDAVWLYLILFFSIFH
jgi:cytochrome c oxidase subunit 3